MTPHLILHFDINETILVGDEAGGDSVEECLNKVIAKSAFCRIETRSATDQTLMDHAESNTNLSLANTIRMKPTHWWDGTTLEEEDQRTPPCFQKHSKDRSETKVMPVPPLYTGWTWPQFAVPYYRTAYKRHAKQFTRHAHGRCYHPLYRQLERTFVLPKQDHVVEIRNDHAFHRMIPSFFQTLVELQKRKWSYTLVLRTFGSDLEDVAHAIQDFARGKHPLFPEFHDAKLAAEWDKDHLYTARWRKTESSANDLLSPKQDAVYDLYPHVSYTSSHPPKPVASGDEAVLDIIENCRVCGIQDDYSYWDAHKNAPWAGKPVWIRKKKISNVPLYHHILFDDNIHHDTTDSIASVRLEYDDEGVCNGRCGSFKTLTGEETIELQGSHLIRVPTVCAIQELDWFIKKIELALGYNGVVRSPLTTSQVN